MARSNRYRRDYSQVPSLVLLKVCIKCGLTDRHRALEGTHYQDGIRCDGEIINVRYTKGEVDV